MWAIVSNRYASKVYGVFQLIDGLDILLFVMFVQEHSVGPNAGRSFIAYLDSGIVCSWPIFITGNMLTVTSGSFWVPQRTDAHRMLMRHSWDAHGTLMGRS